ncbi:MAG: hypothetical protein WA828_14410 [Coleofasciculaceae cyanobacterium]
MCELGKSDRVFAPSPPPAVVCFLAINEPKPTFGDSVQPVGHENSEARR